MLGQPNILLIDNNPISEKLLEKSLAGEATLHLVANVHQAAEIIACEPIDLILINADTYSINAATTCAWLKGDPSSSQIKLVVLTQVIDSHKEFKYYQSGADDVIHLSAQIELVRLKILRHTTQALAANLHYKAQCTLNQFYEQTYASESLSECMSACLVALQEMNLKAALHVNEHPELTCSSFGYVNDYEKALLSYAECIAPSHESGRFTLGNETLAILIQDLPNPHHPLYKSLVEWVKKLFKAISHKAQQLLTPAAAEAVNSEPDIPQTATGAQRLHYYVEKALAEMENSCEAEINRSIGRVDELSTWTLTPKQKRHIFQLRDNLLQLKETLITNCLEIESRYLQFVTERRAKSRINLGW